VQPWAQQPQSLFEQNERWNSLARRSRSVNPQWQLQGAGVLHGLHEPQQSSHECIPSLHFSLARKPQCSSAHPQLEQSLTTGVGLIAICPGGVALSDRPGARQVVITNQKE